MKRKPFDEARDQRIADEVEQVERHLMCTANGCPRRWSVSGDRGKACSAHYWSEPRDWPRITQRLIDDEIDRARYADASRPAPAPNTREQREAIAEGLQRVVAERGDGRAWARELQRRHQSGARVTPAEVEAYRRALRLDSLLGEEEFGA